MDDNVQRVTDFFVKQWNTKNPDHPLDGTQMDLENANKVLLPATGKISSHINDYNDLFIVHKPVVTASHEQHPPGSVQCKNLGCNKWFLEEANTNVACHYHKGAPVFHDLSKYWSCCDHKKALDWDEFQAIPACKVGRHNAEQMVQLFKPSEQVSAPCVAAPLTQEQIVASTAKPKPLPPKEDKPGPIVDGQANCRNQGCNTRFVVAENKDGACSYHSGAPIFHDTDKYWSCCASKKCWNWEEFMAVPGCAKGQHKV